MLYAERELPVVVPVIPAAQDFGIICRRGRHGSDPEVRIADRPTLPAGRCVASQPRWTIGDVVPVAVGPGSTGCVHQRVDRVACRRDAVVHAERERPESDQILVEARLERCFPVSKDVVHQPKPRRDVFPTDVIGLGKGDVAAGGENARAHRLLWIAVLEPVEAQGAGCRQAVVRPFVLDERTEISVDINLSRVWSRHQIQSAGRGRGAQRNVVGCTARSRTSCSRDGPRRC